MEFQAKITTKGQVTIPKHVRTNLGLRRGDILVFQEEQGKYVLSKKQGNAALRRYVGFLKEKSGQDPDRLVAEMRDQ